MLLSPDASCPPRQCLAPPGRDGLEQQPLDGDRLAGEQGRSGDGDGVGRGGGQDEAAGRGEGGGRDGVEGGGGGGEDHGGQAEEEQALGGDSAVEDFKIIIEALLGVKTPYNKYTTPLLDGERFSA